MIEAREKHFAAVMLVCRIGMKEGRNKFAERALESFLLAGLSTRPTLVQQVARELHLISGVL